MQNSNTNTNVNTNTIYADTVPSAPSYYPVYYEQPVAYPAYYPASYYQSSTYTYYSNPAPGMPNTGLGGNAVVTSLILLCAAATVVVCLMYIDSLIKEKRLAKAKTK
ncbi:MAG: hypothetical protein V4481_00745 [Patescibacteria group bacterium]